MCDARKPTDRRIFLKPAHQKLRFSSALWPGLGLALVLVLYKAMLLRDIGGVGFGFLLTHPAQLQIPTYQDTAFAFAVTVLGALAVLATARWPRVQRGVWICFVAFCVLCVFFSVCSYPVFEYLRTPLSISLIRAGGDLSGIRTSISGYVSNWEIAMLVLVPAVYLVGIILLNRYLPVRSPVVFSIVLLAIGGALTAQWLLSARRIASDKWTLNDSQTIVMNPQWIMLSSSYDDATNRRSVSLSSDFPPDFLGDFRPGPHVAHHAFSAKPRNVILIVLESTSTRYMGIYGSPYDTTPVLDSERGHCLVFDNFYAHVGQTALSLVALTTSRYPNFRYAHSPMADRAATDDNDIGRVLKGNSYRTGFFSSSSLAFQLQRQFLTTQGFDQVGDPDNFGAPKLFSWGVSDSCMMDHLIDWIRQEPGKPFYAVAWTIQTHAPYAPTPGKPVIDFLDPQGSQERASLNRYLNAEREADFQIGRLFAALREAHLDQNTVVMITGDHGEAFGDLHDSHFHGLNLFEEDIHVPLIMWSPALFSGESHSETVGGHIDIGPTALDLMGLNIPAAVQGRSLFDPSRQPRVYFFQNKSYLLFGLRSENWKYIYNSVTGKEQMFDLEHDPHEQANVAGQNPNLAHEFRQRIAAWVQTQTKR